MGMTEIERPKVAANFLRNGQSKLLGGFKKTVIEGREPQEPAVFKKPSSGAKMNKVT